MGAPAFHIDYLPELNDPLLIAGFGGWGNALNVSSSMTAYLIETLSAGLFARLNADLFYRWDESRPKVNIQEGRLVSFTAPGGALFSTRAGSLPNDVVILQAEEPQLRWQRFAVELLVLCSKLGVRRLVTVGSMYDSVLHTDRVISAMASSELRLKELENHNIHPISYQGPSAVHAIIQDEAVRRGLECMSLWCHCPYYLQGVTHFGLMSALAGLLSFIGGFDLEIETLERRWQQLASQIGAVIEDNPEVQAMIAKLRKEKVKGAWAESREAQKKSEKVICLKDFMDSH